MRDGTRKDLAWWWRGRGPGFCQPGRGERDRRSARGLITFALGFIPVYNNLSVVARGTRRAGEERPGGTGAESVRDRQKDGKSRGE